MNPIVVERVFQNVKAEKLWEAITHLHKLNIWDFTKEMSESRVGEVFEFYEPNGTDFFHRCEILQFKENEILEHTWTYPLISKGTSTVQWNLKENKNDTILEFKHFGTENLTDGGDAIKRENFIAGWTEIVTQIIPNYLNKK